jgi:predicted DsbA family dithiol-disulfide isomerase
MYEIFLFVNPLGIACFKNEQILREFFAERGLRVSLTFVPIVNSKTVTDDMQRKGLPSGNFNCFRQTSEDAYEALRLFHAIKLSAGNKKARRFIFDLQEKVNCRHLPYSTGMAAQVADDLGLDFSELSRLSHVSALQKSIAHDQEIAARYQVKKTPTAVIFNEATSGAGILIEGLLSEDGLAQALVSQVADDLAPAISSCQGGWLPGLRQ